MTRYLLMFPANPKGSIAPRFEACTKIKFITFLMCQHESSSSRKRLKASDIIGRRGHHSNRIAQTPCLHLERNGAIASIVTILGTRTEDLNRSVSTTERLISTRFDYVTMLICRHIRNDGTKFNKNKGRYDISPSKKKRMRPMLRDEF